MASRKYLSFASPKEEGNVDTMISWWNSNVWCEAALRSTSSRNAWGIGEKKKRNLYWEFCLPKLESGGRGERTWGINSIFILLSSQHAATAWVLFTSCWCFRVLLGNSIRFECVMPTGHHILCMENGVTSMCVCVCVCVCVCLCDCVWLCVFTHTFTLFTWDGCMLNAHLLHF